MTIQEDKTYRIIEMHHSRMVKGGRCEHCKQIRPLDYHEIISRSRTLNNEDARNLSFQRQLCSLLCQDCHAKAGGMIDELLRKNIKVYGYEAVANALEAVRAALKSRLDIELPNEEDLQHGEVD